jgi:hypothetical protein
VTPVDAVDKNISQEYDNYSAIFLARLIEDLRQQTTVQGSSFAQQHILQKGLKVFGHAGKAACSKELKQLVDRECFTPI